MPAIREYTPEDRAALERCLAHLQDFIAELDPLGRLRSAKDFDAQAYTQRTLLEVQHQGGAIFVAEKDGGIVGCVIGVVMEEDSENLEGYPSRDGRVVELVVLPEHRGESIGKELMNAIENFLSSKGCSVIKVDCFGPNLEAHRFYEQLGYTDRLITLIKPTR